MLQYIARRLVSALPVLLGILFVTFALARLLPGDPCRAALGERATDAVCDAFEKRYGLDRPIPVQFWIYLKDVLRGDLGMSFRQGRPTMDILVERLPTTIELAIAAMIFATLLGIPLGIISAYWRNSPIDVGTMLMANVGFTAGLCAGADAGISLCNCIQGHASMVAAFWAVILGGYPTASYRNLGPGEPFTRYE